MPRNHFVCRQEVIVRTAPEQLGFLEMVVEECYKAGASMLGECALVPYHSPISDSGILFYNTLLDENASCHMALGDGYSSCLENASSYTPAQARKPGVNQSMIHEDFMIGSPDLSVNGITEDGTEIPIFVNGG